MIEHFWDPHIRQWTVLIKDHNGDQVGTAQYAANKARLEELLANIQDCQF